MSETKPPPLIYDVGAHKGEDSAFYLKLGYKVVAVEANPELAMLLSERFAREAADGRFILVDKAIGAGGPVTFYVNLIESVWGTTDPEWARRNEDLGAASDPITIESVRFSDLLREQGCPDYLKVDVEGADMLCIEGLRGTDCRPRFLSIESNKTSWRDLKREFDVLESLGYDRFKIVNQKKHRPGRFRTVGGELAAHEFEEGATGPFGEMLPGRWLSRKEALRRYARIFAVYKMLGDNTPLERLLKNIPVARRLLSLVSWYDTHATSASPSQGTKMQPAGTHAASRSFDAKVPAG